MDNQKRAQAVALAQAQAQAQAGNLPPPPQRPPSANAAPQRPPSRQAPTASQLDGAREQLLQQAKGVSAGSQASPQLSTAVVPSSNATSFGVPGGKVNVEPTMEQMAEAKNFVATMRAQWEQNRRSSSFPSLPPFPSPLPFPSLPTNCTYSSVLSAANIKLMQVPDEQKQQVALLTHELVPHVKRVVEMLPLFYAMTTDAHAVRKMLTFVR